MQPLLLFLRLYIKKSGKTTKLTVIDDCTVTVRIQYWSPEASNVVYLTLVLLISHSALKFCFSTIEGPRVLPDKKSFHPIL